MGIPMTQIPSNLLVPGQYQQVDNSLAGSTGDIKKVLLAGYKTADGSAEAGKPVRVFNAVKAAEYGGYGSPCATMAEAFLSLNTVEECWILPLPEPEEGTAWRKSFAVSGGANSAGSVTVVINGASFSAGVSLDDTPDMVAAAIVAAINSRINLPVSAEVDEMDETQLFVTSLVKGTVGNYNRVAMTSAASGISLDEVETTAGTLTIEIKDYFPALGGTRYNFFVWDFDDAENLKALADELDSRYGAMRQIGGRAFIALSGIIGGDGKAGGILDTADGVNNPHLILLPRFEHPQLPCEWAARFCAASCRLLADDPAANTYDTPVTGLTAGDEADFDTRQKLLEAGVATWRLDPAGTVLIERLVTSYTENSDGVRDTSYLDVQVVETVDAVRTYINAEAKKRFKSWKLAGTEENFGSGAKVMTHGVFRSFLAELYSDVFIKDKQWCQDFDTYKRSVVVEIKTDSKTRLEYSHQPNLIGQFYIGAGLLQFK